MNFEAMPELHWKLGYPLAIALMVGACGYLFYLPGQSGWL
jgi:magnesium transporter